MTESKDHLWQGEWMGDGELERRLLELPKFFETQSVEPLDLGQLFSTVEIFSAQLKNRSGCYPALFEVLAKGGDEEAAHHTLREMGEFIARETLERKLIRELGSLRPFLPTRTQFTDSIFEAWAPLGLLTHVAPSNAATVAPLSVVEGLLSGNRNILKTSAVDGIFPQLFLKCLLDCDSSQKLKSFVIAARISSQRKDLLKALFQASDGISAWGGEQAMQSIRALAPFNARVIEWGHKISFAYVAKNRLSDSKTIQSAARECCIFEQQACSSPQCIYVEAENDSELFQFAEEFSKALNKVSASPEFQPQTLPESSEQAEITLVTELAKQEACFGRGKVIEAKDKSWRVLVDARGALTASPLFRTVWIKPLSRKKIVSTLRPMRGYLQSVGLSCDLEDAVILSQSLISAGALRVRRMGEMTGSYSGEPHDGVYALQRFCKRVSFQIGPEAKGISSFSELALEAAPNWPASCGKTPILGKADFQEAVVDPRFAHLYFKSGGSLGEPKLSIFSYDDYQEQMRIGAEGLYAAGLDPLVDRNMNLFFSGSLYGGFLDIFSVLENMRAIQFPMAAQLDFEMVAQSIIKNEVNSILGMPSYIVQLFEKEGGKLSRYGKVKKVYYGGEHFNDAQKRLLIEKFGVELIKSVGYGSVDTGPLGYQCVNCEGGEHHLHQRLQFLEIVKIEQDEPVTGEDVGRLIFTSRMRRGQKLDRYELGDVGHWIKEPCPCGRLAPKFRLLGRSGDVFRIGSIFLNYRKFANLLSESLDYASAVQIFLKSTGLRESVGLHLSEEAAREKGIDSARARLTCLENYDDLSEVVVDEKILDFEVILTPSDQLKKSAGSGKLLRVIDLRESGRKK